MPNIYQMNQILSIFAKETQIKLIQIHYIIHY